MTDTINKEIRQYFPDLVSENNQVVAVYIFGSRSKGTHKASSDIDIGILCLDKSKINQLKLATKLEDKIKKIETDVVFVDINSDPILLIEIINGEIIYQKNVLERTNLETRILHRYEDFRHLMKISNYYLEKSFKEGVYANK